MANADRRQARFPDDDHNKDIGRPVEREQGADEDGKGKAATTSGDDDKPVEGEQGADDDDNKAVRALDHKGCKRILIYASRLACSVLTKAVGSASEKLTREISNLEPVQR